MEVKDAVPHVLWAQEAGFVVMSHSGGASSVPGVAPITVDDLIAMRPDIAGHINGERPASRRPTSSDSSPQASTCSVWRLSMARWTESSSAPTPRPAPA